MCLRLYLLIDFSAHLDVGKVNLMHSRRVPHSVVVGRREPQLVL